MLNDNKMNPETEQVIFRHHSTGQQAVIRHQQLPYTVGLYGVFLHTRKSRQFRRGKGNRSNHKIRRKKLADDHEIDMLT